MRERLCRNYLSSESGQIRPSPLQRAFSLSPPLQRRVKIRQFIGSRPLDGPFRFRGLSRRAAPSATPEGVGLSIRIACLGTAARPPLKRRAEGESLLKEAFGCLVPVRDGSLRHSLSRLGLL